MTARTVPGMFDMAGTIQNVVGFGGASLAVAGGVVAQVSSSPSVGDTGMYVGFGGLAAALALLVSSLGDKVGPHVVAIAKLIVENRAAYVALRGENLNLARSIVDLKARVTEAEAEAARAAEAANRSENLLIVAKARADRRFEGLEASVGDAHRKADQNTATLAAGSGDAIPIAPAPEPTP